MSHSKIQKIKCDNFLYISSSPNKPSLCYLSQLPRQCYRHATAYAAQSHSCPVAPKEKTDSENKSSSQRYLKCLTNAQNKRKAVNKLHAHILMWLPWRSVGWSPVSARLSSAAPMTSGWWTVFLNDLDNVIAVDPALALSGDALLDQHGATAWAWLGRGRWRHACAALLDDNVLVRTRASADFPDFVPGTAAATSRTG